MTDVTDRLADLGKTPIGPPSASAVEGDLARGQAALRRRQRRAGVTALSLVAVAGGGAAWFASGGPQQSRPAPAVAAATRGVPLKIKLVDFVGQEPQGFHIGTIPQGYDLDLQAATANDIVIAPSGDADKDADSFVGKLVVSAEDASTFGSLSSLGHQSVTVGGQPGRLGDDGTATQIWWQVGSIMIDVQCWDSIGLTHDQLVTFASTVTTTPQLQLSEG
ncbi:MAG TPA: hypothetical protein VHV57_15920 [Acidimicrobiales bacterium]|jgi:hypothetical protein|nr:hypothetical protein [Acidimicrobiales bacterium]